MATRQKRKPARRTAARKKNTSSGLPVKIVSWLLMLSLFVFSLGVLGYVVFFQTVQAAEFSSYPTDEAGVVFEEPDPPEHHAPVPGGKSTSTEIPQIAIIIDDMGYHEKEGKALLEIPYQITFSFLPYAPFMTEAMETAYQNGRTVLLHLPMQPKSTKWSAGEGALLVDQSQSVQLKLLESELQLVHYATGVNNHMGSLFTEQREPMRAILGFLKDNGLFWVDSFTTADSVGFSLANEMGVKAARRHFFLDNQQQPEKICRQLGKLVAYAEEKGSAIGIGHPYPETVEALKKCLPEYDDRVAVVGVDELVK